MGFFSNLFKRNKPKMIEAPKEESVTVVSSIESKNEHLVDNSSFNANIKELLVCQFDQALKEYDDWYSKPYHGEKEKYQGAIDIVGVRDGEDLVILNYKSAKTKENDKIALAIVKILGENRVEKLRYLRQKLDSMVYTIYNKNLKNNDMKEYLQEKMDEIKSGIFDIEFTYEGEHLLLNKGPFVDRTVAIDMEYIDDKCMIKDYRRRFNTFELPEEAYSYTTTITRKVKKMDERKEEKYKKEHYINDLQSLGKIAGAIGLLEEKEELRRGVSTIEYSNALRDAVIMLRNSKYANSVKNITTRDALQKNVQLIAECVRNLIGDTSAYYENITEEAIEGIRYNNINVDRDILSSTLRLGKKVIYERAEYLKKNDDKINEEISKIVSEQDKQASEEQIQNGINRAMNTDIQLANNQKQVDFRAGIKVSESQLAQNPNISTQEKTTEKSTRTTDESEISDN